MVPLCCVRVKSTGTRGEEDERREPHRQHTTGMELLSVKLPAVFQLTALAACLASVEPSGLDPPVQPGQLARPQPPQLGSG